MLQLHLSYAVSRHGLPAVISFRQWVATTLQQQRKRTAELSIRVVDLEEGRELNRQYRGKDYATNVLSFPAELPPGIQLPLLGDLVICAPVVKREATEQGKILRDHYAHLTVHGLLHLLGHDHESETAAEHMEAIERNILTRFGIANPYCVTQQ